jgi:4-hydroxymandelate oxidase
VDVAEVGRHSGPFWQQIYVPQDRSLIDGFLDRVVSAGASALVLTVDQPAAGNTLPFRADLSRLAVNGVLPGGRGNFSDLPPGTPLGTATDLGPADIERLLRRTGLPIVVKGVLRADDARTAIDAGASAVVVSNHGGRQLACGVPTARALAGVVEAVEGRVPVLVDSGVRNGEHVIKACALGAAAVLIGRPVARALQQDGAAGVTAWGRELIADVHRTFALCGVADLSQVTEDLVISA